MIPTHYQIEVGDIVRVDINGAQITLFYEAEVLAKPQSTGDSWIFRNVTEKEPETIMYVSEGCTLTLKRKKYTGKI